MIQTVNQGSQQVSTRIHIDTTSSGPQLKTTNKRSDLVGMDIKPVDITT